MSSSPIHDPAFSSPNSGNIATRLQDANERKSAGNDHFRQSRWTEALVAYQSAINILPKRKDPPAKKGAASLHDDLDDENVPGSGPSTSQLPEGDEDCLEDETHKHAGEEDVDKEEEGIAMGEVEGKEVAQLRSVLHANIGACHVKLVCRLVTLILCRLTFEQGEHKQAVEACTKALKDDPTYIKALQRRAASNNILDTWSSLTAVQDDYNVLLSLIQPTSQKAEIESKLRKLKPRLEAAQKRETSEMLDKLKGLGDSLLGNFGLSTNNFKFEPNGQGGYSMNFVR
ncbi:hypothetical protein DFP72DRAFT_16252 [Ephemerocybe angulata]|uniref:TPR-like protein n=1 Tax=Ephemerocybe angulata TaxID=980116 RepID=A0A8H6IKT2_9AGAR|nr:hypothetical protein DFP72DRAFT_16252 [Tulosesus angulatus]